MAVANVRLTRTDRGVHDSDIREGQERLEDNDHSDSIAVGGQFLHELRALLVQWEHTHWVDSRRSNGVTNDLRRCVVHCHYVEHCRGRCWRMSRTVLGGDIKESCVQGPFGCV